MTYKPNPRILTYVTTDHKHERVREITQAEGVKLVREAGLFEQCGAENTARGDCVINKFAAQVDSETDLWVYNHDGRYWLTSPKKIPMGPSQGEPEPEHGWAFFYRHGF